MHDNKKIINRLNIIKGQVDGVINMIENDRYCVDVSNQVMAITSALKSVNRQILSNHLRSCVNDSFLDDQVDSQEKIEEIIKIIDKLDK
ncbi:MAG: metal-sensitive transcriptional regulator [Tissierellia bacterium]|nr:metal-sensitive transcriptional regulator [Tissierellia bacterium]